MRKIFFFLLPVILFMSCRTSKELTSPQPMDKNAKDIPYTILKGYFLRNTHIHKAGDDAELLLVDNKAAMDDLLGVAKTMSNTIDTPDFSKNTVGIVICRPTNMKTKIELNYVKSSEKNLYISADVSRYEEQSFLAAPILVFQFPRQEGRTLNATVITNTIGENK